VQKRKTVRAGFVESQWKPYFDCVESSRLRRGKSAQKQGISVSALKVLDGYICAQVKGGGFRSDDWQVKIPMVDRWDGYLDEVAIWLSRRPDWLASLLAESWEPSFLEFVAGSGLKLFPDEDAAARMVKEASCTCSDWEKPCPHMVAVVYDIVRNMETKPLSAFEYVGLDTTELLNRIHVQSVEHSHVDSSVMENVHDPISSVLLWPEEKTVLMAEHTEVESLKHRIRPQLDPQKIENWKKDYMAWK
jgi:uncharacterized Zn finger protein